MIWPFKKKVKETPKPLPGPEEVYPACPLFQCKCLEGKCAWWVPLIDNYVDEKSGKPAERAVGSCAVFWIPKMVIELRQAVERVKQL